MTQLTGVDLGGGLVVYVETTDSAVIPGESQIVPAGAADAAERAIDIGNRLSGSVAAMSKRIVDSFKLLEPGDRPVGAEAEFGLDVSVEGDVTSSRGPARQASSSVRSGAWPRAMTSLADVVSATCRIVDADGRLAGSGFVVLPEGWVLTCHHVIRGLQTIHVVPQGGAQALPAAYDIVVPAPGADVAVLSVKGLDQAPVQLGELRANVEAAGVGFRPSELATQPRGRVFTGQLTLGQAAAATRSDIAVCAGCAPDAQRPPSTRGPDGYHAGEVANLSVAGGLEQGVSGGPVFDTDARRVVGLFRAIEGVGQAYVLPLDLLDASWPDLLETNRSQVADTALDELRDSYGIGLVREGARRQRPQPWRDFEPLFALHRMFAGRVDEIARLDDLLASSQRNYALAQGHRATARPHCSPTGHFASGNRAGSSLCTSSHPGSTAR